MILSALLATQWVEPKFENVAPNGALTPVKRKNSQFPLWDQDNRGGWKRFEAMSDEFGGSVLDRAKWHDTNPDWLGRQPGWFNPKNVGVSRGMLRLTTRLEEPTETLRAQGYHTFSNAAVKSKGTVLYGAFEVRARPMSSAASSSFWFYNASADRWTEIDVFEIGARAKGFEKHVHMTVHVFHTPEIKEHHQITGTWVSDLPLDHGFRTYGLEWDAAEIRFYIDGALVRKGENRYWHQPLTLNFDSETMPDWLGLPLASELPATFQVDYVRAWQKG